MVDQVPRSYLSPVVHGGFCTSPCPFLNAPGALGDPTTEGWVHGKFSQAEKMELEINLER